MRRAVDTEHAPRPIGPYSHAIDTGGLVFCAGQVGLDPGTGRLVDGDAAVQAERAILNLAAVLASVGRGLADVVKTTVFRVAMADGPAMSAVYGRIFPAPYPARSTVAVAALPAGARVEIEAIAVRRG